MAEFRQKFGGICAEIWPKFGRNSVRSSVRSSVRPLNSGGMGGWLGGMGGWLGRKTWHFFRFLARRKRPRQKSKKMLKNGGGISAEIATEIPPKLRRNGSAT